MEIRADYSQQYVEKRPTSIQEALENLEKEDKRHHNPVGPVFGWIKQGMGFRRWTVMGLANVQAQWSLLCLTVNLKKLLPHWLDGRLALV